MQQLTRELRAKNIKYECYVLGHELWLLLFDETNELVMSVKRTEKGVKGAERKALYCVSENCTKSIRLGLHYEDEFDTVEDVLDRYYKLLT
ncbi:hypothetical protein TVAG_583370 [Trichomonas vaginalis G3]|uniref:Uncharacterized protein n=1 Tax=Trichomonas vaginalis (strain ATCC PRA-98 / G3) TaxID=412133 RepID=A2HHM4_TRIV3|nr:hypothetical protein TVAGG3_0761720 [Trichomonas vaginalis G3]EAX71093.1 hypothetical protein TVAG_583370 [Trichomonas vaginalis G3]KAI5513239.1 hypothetical protein TVAGG3_0761720 [Trichomonas vaginalis G3]|eukprot:XP_001284023.1 hypothetical protein [Trichomonas vaginalis G3]